MRELASPNVSSWQRLIKICGMMADAASVKASYFTDYLSMDRAELPCTECIEYEESLRVAESDGNSLKKAVYLYNLDRHCSYF